MGKFQELQPVAMQRGQAIRFKECCLKTLGGGR